MASDHGTTRAGPAVPIPEAWQDFVESVPESVLVVAPDGSIVHVNSQLAELTGFRADGLRGAPLEVLIPEGEQLRHAAHRPHDQLHPTRRPMGVGSDVTCRRQDGTTFPADVRIASFRCGGVAYLVATIRDETERRRREDDLFHQAVHDPLTGLPNRVLLLDRLEQALARTPRHRLLVAVLYVDLNGFKEVNDRWGHAAGDEVLRAVADRLAATVRPGDTVARFGGDEFVVLCEGVAGSDDAVVVGERLLDALAAPIAHRAGTARITASIGVALASAESRDGHLMVDAADRAMYRAKHDHAGLAVARQRGEPARAPQ